MVDFSIADDLSVAILTMLNASISLIAFAESHVERNLSLKNA